MTKLVIRVDSSSFNVLKIDNERQLGVQIRNHIRDFLCGGVEEAVSPILWGSDNAMDVWEAVIAEGTQYTEVYCLPGDKLLRSRPIRDIAEEDIARIHAGNSLMEYVAVEYTDKGIIHDVPMTWEIFEVLEMLNHYRCYLEMYAEMQGTLSSDAIFQKTRAVYFGLNSLPDGMEKTSEDFARAWEIICNGEFWEALKSSEVDMTSCFIWKRSEVEDEKKDDPDSAFLRAFLSSFGI